MTAPQSPASCLGEGCHKNALDTTSAATRFQEGLLETVNVRAVRGVLYTDCMHVNDVLRCYVLGDPGPPKDCAPTVPGAPEVSAAALIASNRSLDGLEGSICTIGALGDQDGNVFNCANSLSCRQFPVSTPQMTFVVISVWFCFVLL